MLYLSKDGSHYRALSDAKDTRAWFRALKAYCKQENITLASELIAKREKEPSMWLFGSTVTFEGKQ